MLANRRNSGPKKKFFDNMYQDPFQSPRASHKHTGNQVNGETQQNQSEIIAAVQMRKKM